MSGLRCWPGCLAEVEADPEFPQNVGIRVVVVGRADEAEYGELWGEEWEIVPRSAIRVWDDDERTVAVTSPPGARVAFHDRYLRPITPPPESTEDATPVEHGIAHA